MREGVVGWLMVGGALTSLVSFALILVFAIAGVFRGTYTRTPGTNEITDVGAIAWIPMMTGLLVLGAVAFSVGLGIGLWTEARGRRGPRRVIPNVRVVARFGFNRQGMMLSDRELDDDEDARAYVKVVLPNGVAQEFECSREVYYSTGEGMVGEAEVQGRWLGRFGPQIGPS